MSTSEPLYEQVYESIKKKIIFGIYRPGERLTDNRLVEDLGTSRTPIREAIQQLVRQGLLVNEPNKGVTVFNPTLAHAAEIYALRASVEGVAAGLAAVNEVRKRYLFYMLEELERSEKAFDQNEIDTITESNLKFHDLIIESSGSELLKEFLENLKSQSMVLRHNSLTIKRRAEVSLVEHRQIYEMLKNGKSREAEEFTRKHILSAGFRFLNNNKNDEIESLPIFNYYQERMKELLEISS
ncbi:MAG: hypothetical protein JM58_16285 [Peptococcaceae bacterium BICA1-8]|nr:MAG: hypothetical protein JM58_16285 [Peptococcaceae bacterium BICA1-8]